MPDLDPDALKQFQFLVFSKLEGAVTAGMIHLGDRLGLYRALAAADAPLTTAELAERTGLDERWVREWAYNQAAAKIIVADADGERFSLTPEAVAVLAATRPRGVRHGHVPLACRRRWRCSSELPESFRTGLGHDYDSHGPEAAVGMERSFEPWNRAHLLPTVLPTLDGVHDEARRRAAASSTSAAAPGGAVLLLAEAFPASTVAGYDISQHALDRARDAPRRRPGLANASFHDPREEPLPADHSVDLVTTFDCIHDMTDPQAMMAAIRGAARATTARGCSSTSRPATRSRRTSARTRWRR